MSITEYITRMLGEHQHMKMKSGYYKLYVDLDSSGLSVIPASGAYIDVDDEETTADRTKIYIAFDESPFMRLDHAPFNGFFERIVLKWDQSQVGKRVVLIVGHYEFRTIRTRADARIVDDNVGLAKDETLKKLIPERGQITQDLASQTINANSSIEITKNAIEGWSALVVTVRATYDANATAGVRVIWLYSPDGANYDSEDDAISQGNYYDLSFAAGATRQATILVPLLAPYVRIVIKNLDVTYPATVDMWSWYLR